MRREALQTNLPWSKTTVSVGVGRTVVSEKRADMLCVFILDVSTVLEIPDCKSKTVEFDEA